MNDDPMWFQYAQHVRAACRHSSGQEVALGNGRWTFGARVFRGNTQAEADRKRNVYQRTDRAVGL